MTSFDIASLFTNIPVEETINIISNEIFSNKTHYNNFDKASFKTLLSLASNESFFIFNGTPYMQVDGVSMGSPLGPTLANSFLCHHEQLWLDRCPLEFKPLYYKRFVDDTFILFREQSHSNKFLDYLNNQHQNIKFTMETETNKQIPFLDMNIVQEDGKISTSIYRKPTFSGLGMSFFSFCAFNFKVNNIKTMLFRAYNLSSSYIAFTKELDFLRKYFQNNGYPLIEFEKCCSKFLNKIFQPSTTTCTVAKQKVYFSFPFYGQKYEDIYEKMKSQLSTFYPHLDFRFSYKNTFTIASHFRFKDTIPIECRSGVIYEFNCDCRCASYIGATHKKLKVRVDQHLGISHRTGRQLTTIMDSQPRNHCHTHDHTFNRNQFKIIDSCQYPSDLPILESLYISAKTPNLNNQRIAAPLYVSPSN